MFLFNLNCSFEKLDDLGPLEDFLVLILLLLIGACDGRRHEVPLFGHGRNRFRLSLFLGREPWHEAVIVPSSSVQIPTTRKRLGRVSLTRRVRGCVPMTNYISALILYSTIVVFHLLHGHRWPSVSDEADDDIFGP